MCTPTHPKHPWLSTGPQRTITYSFGVIRTLPTACPSCPKWKSLQHPHDSPFILSSESQGITFSPPSACPTSSTFYQCIKRKPKKYCHTWFKEFPWFPITSGKSQSHTPWHGWQGSYTLLPHLYLLAPVTLKWVVVSCTYYPSLSPSLCSDVSLVQRFFPTTPNSHFPTCQLGITSEQPCAPAHPSELP